MFIGRKKTEKYYNSESVLWKMMISEFAVAMAVIGLFFFSLNLVFEPQYLGGF